MTDSERPDAPADHLRRPRGRIVRPMRWLRSRRRLWFVAGPLALCGAVLLFVWVRGQRWEAAAAEAEAAGLRVTRLSKNWPLVPAGWAKWLPVRRGPIVGVSTERYPPSVRELLPPGFQDSPEDAPRIDGAGAVDLLARLPPLRIASLENLGLGDAEAMRLAVVQPSLRQINLTGNRLSLKGVQALLAMPDVRFLRVDQCGLSDDDLLVAARGPNGAAVSRTVARRLVERVLGVPERDGRVRRGAFEIMAAVEDRTTTSAPGPVRSRGLLSTTSFGGDLTLKASSPGGERWRPSPVEQDLLAAIGGLSRLELRGVDVDWDRLGGLKVETVLVEATPESVGWVSGREGLSSVELRGATDAVLRPLRTDARSLTVRGRLGEPFRGEFLNRPADFPNVASLVVTGFPEGAVAEPLAVDFAAWRGLKQLTLRGLPVDGASVRAVRVSGGPDHFDAREMPFAGDADVQAARDAMVATEAHGEPDASARGGAAPPR